MVKVQNLRSKFCCHKVIRLEMFRTLAGPLWAGHRESRRCSRDTYPESYITKYTSIRRSNLFVDDLAHLVELVHLRMLDLLTVAPANDAGSYLRLIDLCITHL